MARCVVIQGRGRGIPSWSSVSVSVSVSGCRHTYHPTPPFIFAFVNLFMRRIKVSPLSVSEAEL